MTHLAGTRLPAGLTQSTVLPEMDFETYSEAGFVWDDTTNKWRALDGASGNRKGLPIVGSAVYTEHPSCEVLSLVYDLHDGRGPRLWMPGMPNPQELFDHFTRNGLVEAWHAAFERWVWKNVCTPKYGWPELPFRQLRCAMAKARVFALPGKLETAGAVMGLAIQKDSDGKRLLDKFSIPRNPTKKDQRRRIRLQDDPEDAQRLVNYNATDIAAEGAVSRICPDIEGEELEFWFVDQTVNERGVKVDSVGLQNCIAVIEQAHARYNAELASITGGIDSASKIQQLQGWLRAKGLYLDGLDEDEVSEALKRPNLAPDVRRVLEIREAVGSASVKKTFAMRNRLTAADRMHDLFIYYGARTGRVTGEGPQPTNSPKAGPNLLLCGRMEKGRFVEGSGCNKHYGLHHSGCPWCGLPKPPSSSPVEWNPRVVDEAFEVMAHRSLDVVEFFYGRQEAMGIISGCIRGLYVAEEDHDLISSDFNSIEAIGLAMISGEKWRIDVFRSHGKIYEASASTMFKVPFDEMMEYKKRTGQHHPLRAKGKIGELAFGYQGWVGSALAFDMPGTEDEIKADILRWRAASPAIEYLWGGQTLGKLAGIHMNADLPTFGTDRWDTTPHYFGVEGMCVRALLEPGTWQHVKRLDGTYSGVSYLFHNDVLYCRLPSDRRIVYHRPRLEPSDRGGFAISYEGWNTNPKNGPKGWIRMRTWGGRLVENIVQATCRDVLRFAMINLERVGYPIVLHIYDEIVAEIRKGLGSVEHFEQVMTIRPPWAHDWPIRAEGGWRGFRYRKG